MRRVLVANVPIGATFYAEEYNSDCTVVNFYGMRALRVADPMHYVMIGAYPNFTLNTDYEGGEDACHETS